MPTDTDVDQLADVTDNVDLDGALCSAPRSFAKRLNAMPSSVIRSFSYDPVESRLDVEFVSGRRYSYLDVPAAEADAMQRVTSKGGFFNRRIRDRYRFVPR